MQNSRVKWRQLALVLAVVLSATDGGTLARADTPIQLSTSCPPGFQLMAGNRCELRSLYQLYASLEDEGMGGTHTGLPQVRDGFSPQEIDLGRYLFFDPILSRDGSISCASCHVPELGFSDGRGRSVGVTGERVPRSAPTLWNVAFLKSFFWDGRSATLEEQMEGPLYAEHEMGNTPEQLLGDLQSSDAWRDLFRQTYGDADITLDRIYRGLAAFEASLISLNSRYDRYAHGHHEALHEKEIEGLNIFRSFVARCSECHTPPLFTNQQLAVLGTPEPEGMERDLGAGALNDEPLLRAAFKVPTLRNIEKSAPYMHSGRFGTLREAVKFYNDGRGHAVPEDEILYINWHVWEPDLKDEELDRLVDFLKTLNDESFMPRTPERVPSGLPLAGPKEPIEHQARIMETSGSSKN